MTEHPLLSQLELTPARVSQLSATLRNRLLHFLLRWESWQETLDCLAVLATAKLVSLQDLQASALLGLGQLDRAITILQRRLVQREAVAPRNELARLYLMKGDLNQALAQAQSVVTTNPDYGPNWSLLGDVYLQYNDLTAAETAFRHHQQLAPGSRQPLIGLMQVHHRRGDAVTAAAYAVRAYTVNEGEFPLSISFLRNLRDFFAITQDENRLTAANEQLAHRFAAELTELNTQIAEELGSRPPLSFTQPAVTAGTPSVQNTPSGAVALLPDHRSIPISAAEQAALITAACEHFGFTTLRPGQAEIMACSRRGEHVLAVLPTGAGKSLCYQLPAMLDVGLTVVISPLIALMKDQIDNLPPELRQQAIAINSSMEGSALTTAISEVVAGRYKIVYVAPERLRQQPFIHALRQRQIARLVIDEAHCVSVWGHDFRPDYLRLAQAHQELGAPPILALTATAPPRVRLDIERQLLGTAQHTPAAMRLIATDIFRPNLHLHVLKLANQDEKLQQLLRLCHMLCGSGIIYTRTRQQCTALTAMLQQHAIQAAAYHAGLPPAERETIQERFMQGATRVIVATIAFGMGIDKADIRFIIHYGLAGSIEAYYQEIGRAGRDGQAAHCILLYTASDKAVLTKLAREELLDKEFLRTLYRALKRRLPEAQPGILPIDYLMKDLHCSDETRLRVALSILEQVGTLTRHHDVPRAVTLIHLTTPSDGVFANFIQKVRLPLHLAVTRSYGDIAATAQIPLTVLEAQLLLWQEASWLHYHASGRDLLLTLPSPPANISAHLDSLLDQYATIQQQRVIESFDYARHRYCRHGYLANYLGGAVRTNCGVCDNCNASLPVTTANPLPTEAEQQQLILTVLAQHGWGRRKLIGLLRGDIEADAQAQNTSVFGKLSFRSENALDKLIDHLIADHLVTAKTLSHGGVALGITPRGRQQLHAGIGIQPI